MENNGAKQKFFSTLSDAFIGDANSKIEGKSGFTNLIAIKSQYFRGVKNNLQSLIDKTFSNDDDKREAYDKLFTFYEVYLNETGTPFFANTPYFKNVYTKIDSNKETNLFWKTKDLYYVKSDIVFTSISELNIDNYIFSFDASEIEHLKNNEKKQLSFFVKSIDNLNKKINISLKYSTRVGAPETKIENLHIEISKHIEIKEEIVKKAVFVYRKQNEIDYFIHKNPKIFLDEQVNLYINQYLFSVEQIDIDWSAERINFIKSFKKIALEINRIIANFENELKAMWEKPKIVKKVNYVLTLNKINSNILKKIFSSQDLTKQVSIWKGEKEYNEKESFKFVDKDFKLEDIFDNEKIKDSYLFLPLDTKYLSEENKLFLLESINNLDKEINGVLINSDNWQALNTIMPKYKKNIDLCYIDPPFNTGHDFLYKDGFQDSTWLTLMENRILLTKELFKESSSFYLHLDHNADYLGRMLLNNFFGVSNFRNSIAWQYFMGGKGNKEFGRKHDNILFYSNKEKENYFNKLKIRRYLDYIPSMIDESKESETGKDDIGYYSVVSCPDVWSIKSVFNMSKEYTSFNTQKPEELMHRILLASSKENDIVIDYFNGSGTTFNVAHKMGRKWIGVEMGEHFYNVNIPRAKKTLFGFISGISELLNSENKLYKGGIFKYYELEQYEETLNSAQYSDKNIFNLYSNEKQLSKVAIIKKEKNDVIIDFSLLFNDFGFAELAETISNVTGKEIKKISKDGVVFADDSKITDLSISIYDPIFGEAIKKLVWWRSE